MKAARLLPTVLLGAVVLSSCAQPEPDFSPDLGPGRQVEPEAVAEESAPLPLTSPAPANDVAPSAAPATESPSPRPASSPEPPPTDAQPAQQPPPAASRTAAPAWEPVTLLALADRVGDHGLEGPDYADLVGVEMVDLGVDVSITLRVAGDLPTRPAEGEVQIMGVDLLESEEGESEYQLTVVGNADGWFAYLQTPQGFRNDPPITFTMGGATISLVVPWNEVGSPTRGPVRGFVQWSRERAVLNATASDSLDGQPHTFDRNP